jgi:hypothetical protein
MFPVTGQIPLEKLVQAVTQVLPLPVSAATPKQIQ